MNIQKLKNSAIFYIVEKVNELVNFVDPIDNSDRSGLIRFTKTYNYGFDSTALTAAFTFDLVGAKAVTIAVRHNHSVDPTSSLPSYVKKFGSYTTSVDNYIYITYVNDNYVLMNINQAG